MKLLEWALILGGVLLNAGAQLMLKSGARAVGAFTLTPDQLWVNGLLLARQPGILGGLACYAVSVVLWVLALSRVEVSVAYPMLSIGYVINALLAWWLFGEAVTSLRLLGIGVIIIGVILVAKS